MNRNIYYIHLNINMLYFYMYSVYLILILDNQNKDGNIQYSIHRSPDFRRYTNHSRRSKGGSFMSIVHCFFFLPTQPLGLNTGVLRTGGLGDSCYHRTGQTGDLLEEVPLQR